MDNLNRLPPSEAVAVTCVKEGMPRFLITAKMLGGGTIYTLYEVCENGYQRLGKGPSPLELENKFHIW